jgi:predicted RND superfamily exporter protein
MTTQWSDLLPEHDPLVQEFNTIMEEYTGTSNSILVLMGNEEKIKAYADKIVPEIEKLDEYVKRVDYRLDVDFIRKHGFMLTKSSDLEKSTDIYKDLNLVPLLTHINDSFERIYIGEEERLSQKEKQDAAINTLDGLEYWVHTMDLFVRDKSISGEKASAAVERLVLGDPYFISPDKRTLLIFVEPAFGLTDMDPIMKSTIAIQSLMDNLQGKYPDVYAGLTGTIPLSHDEMVFSTEDMERSSILALFLVIVLFILSFRLITAPLLAGLNLIISIAFATGIISLFIESLNMMTSIFAVILIGLGVDFSIHVISLYTERRSAGDKFADAMSYTLSRSGPGIITGALTTSIAFFTLMISDTKGIKEMGLVLGLGVISVMICTLIFLPALLVMQEKIAGRIRGLENGRKTKSGLEFRILGDAGDFGARHPKLTFMMALIASGILLVFALNIKFDSNYLNMEPEGIPSVVLQDSLITAFDLSTDFVMITGESIEEVREIAEQAKKVPSVSIVESISNFIPSDDEQAERIPHIKTIRSYLLNNITIDNIDSGDIESLCRQLERLEMNIYEFGQMAFIGGQDRVDKKCARIIGTGEGDFNLIIELVNRIKSDPEPAISGLNGFQNHYMPKFRDYALNMADTNPITLESLPADITDRFVNKSKDRYLVTITPKEQIWDMEFLKRFNGQMERISDKITGTPSLFVRLVELIVQDGARAAVLAIVVVFLLLLIDFRNISMALIGLIPLLTGAVWMVGMMSLLGEQINLVNVMGIPMIIGIGIDDGVHLLHRYRIEGFDKARIVFKSTGRAVLLTSLTTMAGFGSLLIAQYRGFISLSVLLILGVIACFITSVLFLPALISLIKGRKIDPKA